MTSRNDRAREIQRSYSAQVEKIRNDPKLSDVGRRGRLAQLKLDADRKLADLDAADEADYTSARDHLVDRLFGPPNRDRAGSGAEYHAALREAEQIKSPDQMLDTLRLARLSGHTALVQAIGTAAESRARGPFGSTTWGRVVNEWAKHKPGAPQDLEQLDQLDHVADPRTQMRERIFRQMRNPAPSEIQGRDLNHLAAQTDNGDDAA